MKRPKEPRVTFIYAIVSMAKYFGYDLQGLKKDLTTVWDKID